MGTTARQASSTSDLVGEILPQLPAAYAELSVSEQQHALDGARHLLQVRRNVLELVAGQREQRGLVLQWEADAEAVQERLEREPDLPSHRRRHLLGRLDVYRARAERGEELQVQYQMEIDLYRHVLECNGGGNGVH